MPEASGSFIAKELVDELRRSRPTLTLTQIAGEYGESERNFRRYLKGKPMPLAKGRRFARRLAELHLGTIDRLRALSAHHPQKEQAAEALSESLHAFNSAYTFLQRSLDEAANAVAHARLKLKAARQELEARSVHLYREAVRSVENHAPFKLEHFAALIELGLARAH